jgi:hypothetical protein
MTVNGEWGDVKRNRMVLVRNLTTLGMIPLELDKVIDVHLTSRNFVVVDARVTAEPHPFLNYRYSQQITTS